MGFPGVSVLRPTLFNLYANSLNELGIIPEILSYADDTALLVEGSVISRMFDNMQDGLNSVGRYCYNRGLKINAAKTKFVIFHNRRPAALPVLPPLVFDGKKFDRVVSFNYLGIVFDQALNWHEQIVRVRARLSRALGLLQRVSEFVDFPALIAVFHAFFYCHLTHGILA